MTKAETIAQAQSLGLAVYRSDTLATIAARIAQHVVATAERCTGTRGAIANLATLATVHRYRLYGWRQLALPLGAPREWSAVCGMVAT